MEPQQQLEVVHCRTDSCKQARTYTNRGTNMTRAGGAMVVVTEAAAAVNLITSLLDARLQSISGTNDNHDILLNHCTSMSKF